MDDRNACSNLALSLNVTQLISPRNGLVIYTAPYTWCKHNCPGTAVYSPSTFAFVLLGFALPAVIFSIGIPRRWRLDLPDRIFRTRRYRALTFAKIVISCPAICIVAALDMVVWITCIMTFAGPMVLSGVQEMILDYRVVSYLRWRREIQVRERFELVIALLCGNFDHDLAHFRTAILDALIPGPLTSSKIEATKSNLVTIMNAQTDFGPTTGIPAIFFLGGYLYSCFSSPTPTGAVSFGIFWMVLVNLAIISGTLLSGNKPRVVGMLVVDRQEKQQTPRLGLLRDAYDSGIYPVPMWDKGFSKYKWLKSTTLWQEPNGDFKPATEIGPIGHVATALSTTLLLAFPCLISLSYDYTIPFPWLGCLSLLYILYFSAQIFLIIVASALAYHDMPFQTLWTRPKNPLKGTRHSINLYIFTLLLLLLNTLATLTASLSTLFTIFVHLFGLYNKCICMNAVSQWWQANSVVFLAENLTGDYAVYVNLLSESLTWTAATFTSALCLLAWWYQRSLRCMLREVVEGFDDVEREYVEVGMDGK